MTEPIEPVEAGRGGSEAARTLHVIEPSGRWPRLELAEIWRYREVLALLVWRDIQVRYKQTLLGAAWSVLQPALASMVFVLVFGRIAAPPGGDVPYPVFVLAGMVLWTQFANSLAAASDSLLKNESLVRRIYFPRLIIPMAAVAAGLVDALLANLTLAVCLVVYGIAPRPEWLLAPLFLVGTAVAAFGLGSALAAINARYRDVQYVVPFFVQLGLFVSPVVYATVSLPSPWREVFGLNPMAGLIEAYRWVLFGTVPPVTTVALSAAVIAVLVVAGAYIFRMSERTLVDVL
jgi:lipopolysaccharide transport system permease protein